ncbi:MAG TPA: Gfo/Idh/MocA family oxidoreductase, partial [Burkholderiaceae bacterium]|nr:Gfo/Idh/MocA family oxidoreductase [Burkholderiaceae bacterium]
LIATSYGPGRYDPSYESDGIDYPPAYVRWTENRNMQAYLQLLASGAIRLDHLTRSVTPLENATQAYAALNRDEERPLLALLTYPKPDAVPASAVTTVIGSSTAGSKQLRVALIGAGSFAQSMHIPNLERLRDRYALHAVVGRTGASVELIARRHGAKYATTQFERVLEDRDVDAVLIATRHNLHASMVLQALAAGKHVLVEKPLAITAEELSSIERYFSQNTATPLLLTGYNRRFAPALEAARALIQQRATPLVVNYRMNAGYLPLDHWVHGPEGGGRNIGEACHVYDLFGFLTDSTPLRVQAEAISPRGRELRRDDNFVATIRYEDGSVSTLTYTALGASEYPKEKMEIYADGTVLSLEDYRRLDVSGRSAPVWSSSSADKGHLAMLAAFADGVRQMRWPVALQRQLDAMRIAFQVQDAIHS